MLAKANEWHKENVSFIEPRVETMALNRDFDHIFSIHTMHWVKDQLHALRNIYSHLKGNGKIHLILAPSKEGLPFHTALNLTLDQWAGEFEDFDNPQQVYDIESYRRLLVDAGFHVEALHYLFHQSLHPSKEALKAWVAQWLPHPKHLPPSQRDAFMDELITNYLLVNGYSPATDDPVEWGEYVFIVEASKAR